MRAILYKPLNKLFRNRLEEKAYFGMNRLNRLWKNTPDDFIILTDENSISNYEYIYKNAIQPYSVKYKK